MITLTLSPFAIATILSAILWLAYVAWSFFVAEGGLFGAWIEVIFYFFACVIATLLIWLGTFAYLYFTTQ